MSSFVRGLTQFNTKEVDILFKESKIALKNQFVTILAAPAKKEFGKLLSVIPKKIGSAPVRNQLRRRLRAVFYENKLHELVYDLIFIPRKPIVTLTFQEIQNLLLVATKNMLCQKKPL